MLIVGVSSRPGSPKNTFRNLSETGECVINTVFDDPYRVPDWDVSGLAKAPTTTVAPARVQESVFSIEGKMADINEFRDRAKGYKSVAALVMIKAPRFWVREDATDADCNHIDLKKRRPIAQLGGMVRQITSTFDLPRL